MNITVRIPRVLFEEVRNDLTRPHQFAFERVGFFFGPSIQLGDNWLVLLNKYFPVQDSDYIKDKFVGAKINSNSLRTAMQYSLDNDVSAFHVHEHGGLETPWFSNVDTDSLDEIIPPFTVVCPSQVHGGIVLSQTTASALSWVFNTQGSLDTNVTVVGFPTAINKGLVRRVHHE